MTAHASRFFDVEAQRYDAAHDATTTGGYALRARNAAALELIGPGPGTVVDIGMGPGRLLAELARRGWAVAGVDRSGGMVALARGRLPEAADRLIEARMESLPFADGEFDVAVANGVLEYVDDRRAAVSELSRVLRPGGLAVVGIANRASPVVLWRGGVFYPALRALKQVARTGRPVPVRGSVRIGVGQLTRLLAEVGLTVETRRYVAMLPLPSPLDDLLPRLNMRLARTLERRAPAAVPLLAIQLVVGARKAAQ